MKSDNPFVRPLGPDDGPFDAYDDIPAADRDIYPLHDASLKFLHPERITYLNHAVSYLGFDVDDDNKVISYLIYLRDHAAVQDDLHKTFGAPDLTFSMEGQGNTSGGDVVEGTYASATWIRDRYTLTCSVVPVGNETASLRACLAIRER